MIAVELKGYPVEIEDMRTDLAPGVGMWRNGSARGCVMPVHGENYRCPGAQTQHLPPERFIGITLQFMDKMVPARCQYLLQLRTVLERKAIMTLLPMRPFIAHFGLKKDGVGEILAELVKFFGIKKICYADPWIRLGTLKVLGLGAQPAHGRRVDSLHKNPPEWSTVTRHDGATGPMPPLAAA